MTQARWRFFFCVCIIHLTCQPLYSQEPATQVVTAVWGVYLEGVEAPGSPANRERMLAIRRLEDATGIAGPLVDAISTSRGQADLESAIRLWKDWFEENADQLYFEPLTGSLMRQWKCPANIETDFSQGFQKEPSAVLDLLSQAPERATRYLVYPRERLLKVDENGYRSWCVKLDQDRVSVLLAKVAELEESLAALEGDQISSGRSLSFRIVAGREGVLFDRCVESSEVSEFLDFFSSLIDTVGFPLELNINHQ